MNRIFLRLVVAGCCFSTSSCNEPAPESSVRYEVECPRCTVYYTVPEQRETDTTGMTGTWSHSFKANDNFVPQLQARYASHTHAYDSAKATVRIIFNDELVIDKSDSGYYFIINAFFIR